MVVCIFDKGMKSQCLSFNLVPSFVFKINRRRDMIEFVGVVPFFRRITLRVAMETMRFEPCANRFILGQLYLAFIVS